MSNFCQSLIASALVIVIVYFTYWISYRYYSKNRAYAECWWLPRWNCYRFVIRNMHDKGSLTSIHFKAWIRKLVQSSTGSSVNTFIDQELINGERIILPTGQDIPVLCFRFEKFKDKINLIQTDKQGRKMQAFNIDDQFESIIIEYTVKIRSLFFFKHEIIRMYDIPHKLIINKRQVDLFKEYLLPFQGKQEDKLKTVFQTGQEVAVSI